MKLWYVWMVINHPIETYQRQKKWRHRPKVGDIIVDCRGRTLVVTSIGPTEDDLQLSDGWNASWMHCCDYPEKS
jgi:hypothetical protein